MNAIARFLLIVWQLPQALLGFAVYLFCKACLSERVLSEGIVLSDSYDYAFSYVLFLRSRRSARYSAFSLGVFMFVFYDSDYTPKDKMKAVVDKVVRHEFGHSVQSAWLGWVYLIVIGVVSALVSSVSASLARRCYTETWAEGISEGAVVQLTMNN